MDECEGLPNHDEPEWIGWAQAALARMRAVPEQDASDNDKNQKDDMINETIRRPSMDSETSDPEGKVEGRGWVLRTQSKVASAFDLLNFTLTRYTQILARQGDRDAGPSDTAPGVCINAPPGTRVNVGDLLATVEMLKARRSILATTTGVVERVTYGADGLPQVVVKREAAAAAAAPPAEAKISTETIVQNDTDEQVSSAMPTASLFSGALLQQVLQTRTLGRFVQLRYETDSTMRDCARECAQGAPHGALFLAEMQTAGHGRGNGRTWRSKPKGNLYFTLLLRRRRSRFSPSAAAAATTTTPSSTGDDPDLTALHFAVVVAVARACRRCGVDARIKWPNDIWARGRKLSGMLIDVITDCSGTDGGYDAAMVGVGINVNEDMRRASDDADVAAVATSLRGELALSQSQRPPLVCRESLLGDIMNLLELHLMGTAFDPTVDERSCGNELMSEANDVLGWYRRLDLTVGELVTVRPRHGDSNSDAGYTALAVAVTARGTLIVTPIDHQDERPQIELFSALVSVRPSMPSGSRVPNSLSTRSPTREVLVYNGPGTTSVSVEMAMRSLRDVCDPHRLSVRTIDSEALRDGGCLRARWETDGAPSPGLPKVAGVVFPGGADRFYANELAGAGERHLHEYVELDGGVYVGFCAGAYYGCTRVRFDIGGPLEVDEPRALRFFSGDGQGPVYAGFDYASERGARAARVTTAMAAAVAVTERDKDQHLNVYFNGGCCFVGGNRKAEPEVRMNIQETACAWYDTRCGDNGGGEGEGSTGDDVKKVAVVRCSVGRGKVVLSGVHPEFMPHHMIAAAHAEGRCVTWYQKLAADDARRVKLLQWLLEPILLYDVDSPGGDCTRAARGASTKE